MYRTAYQRGMLTVFFSGGSKPLEIWDTQTKDGYIKRFLDQEIKTMVLEIRGANISTTYIICPKGNQVLGIHMPFLVMIVKNLNKYFSFEVTVLDDTGTRRRFRVSNFQSTTQILPLCTVMPIGLSDGWNQIQFNLAEFTRRAYKKEFQEVQKLKINANIRLRRIYFTERLMSEDELPPAYKLYFPLQSKTSAKKAAEHDEAKETTKVTSKADLQATLPAENLNDVQVLKEVSVTKQDTTVSKAVIEKKSTADRMSRVSKIPNIEKAPSGESVPSGEKAPDAEGEPDVKTAPGAEEATGEEGATGIKETTGAANAPEAEGASDAETTPDAQGASDAEKVPSAEKVPEGAHPTDESTAGDTEATTVPESTAEDNA